MSFYIVFRLRSLRSASCHVQNFSKLRAREATPSSLANFCSLKDACFNNVQRNFVLENLETDLQTCMGHIQYMEVCYRS